jgi:hypothetical protein
VVVLLVSGCGSAGSPAAGGASATPVATAPAAAPTPMPDLPVAPFLNIVSVGVTSTAPAGIACPMWAILSQPGAVYAGADVQRMGTFLNQVIQAAHGTYDLDPGVPPPTIQVTHVALNRPDYANTSWNVPWCSIVMQTTNVGTQTVQVPRVGLRLTGTPAPNAAQYPLVEVCSVLNVSQYCGPQFGGGATACSGYPVTVDLSDGPPGTMFAGTPAANPNGPACPEVTLAPGGSVAFVFHVTSSLARDYPAEPYLEVSGPTRTTTYGVPSIAGHLTFADAGQFACYRLTGGSFTLDSTAAAALAFHTLSTHGQWCA